MDGMTSRSSRDLFSNRLDRKEMGGTRGLRDTYRSGRLGGPASHTPGEGRGRHIPRGAVRKGFQQKPTRRPARKPKRSVGGRLKLIKGERRLITKRGKPSVDEGLRRALTRIEKKKIKIV